MAEYSTMLKKGQVTASGNKECILDSWEYIFIFKGTFNI